MGPVKTVRCLAEERDNAKRDTAAAVAAREKFCQWSAMALDRSLELHSIAGFAFAQQCADAYFAAAARSEPFASLSVASPTSSAGAATLPDAAAAAAALLHLWAADRMQAIEMSTEWSGAQR